MGENYFCIFHKVDLCQIFHVSLKRVNVRLFWRRQLETPAFNSHHHHPLLCNPPVPSFPHGIIMILPELIQVKWLTQKATKR